MKKYLSYGGGVNSTAMILLLLDEGWEFESVYVDHGCDWPETREYVKMMAEKYPITVLKPAVSVKGQIYDDLYAYGWDYEVLPSRLQRWCTTKFKIDVINSYIERPCEQMIGIDAGEDNRVRDSWDDDAVNRYPLVERGIDRDGCIRIIKDHGLPVPIKSGCWFCPYQRVSQWKLLRVKHPELFCKAKKLEERVKELRLSKGLKPFFFNKVPLDVLINEGQSVMWPDMKPPCSCGL
ncbi:MAG: phosphoadenosine phosphosulfate reductase family protein [Dehalococcoidia bacterium]|jgi:hypothetical protein